jgi:DNA repair protein RecO (recombination protein O)
LFGSIETEAIVIDCHDYGESDVIITLLSQEKGKIAAIAKGAKKSLKRFVNKLELFSFLHIVCIANAGSQLGFLAEAELHTSFINIRNNLQRYTTASVVREFLLAGTKEEEPDEHLFRLSLWTLHNINTLQQPNATLTIFLIRFFDCLGYRPNLETCNKCGRHIHNDNLYRFVPSEGSIACSACYGEVTGKGIPLSRGTLKILRSAQDLPLERLHRLKISGIMLKETLLLLHDYGNHLLQRDISSWKLMRTYIAT